jgi:Flp pilus assembly protein TadD
MRGIVLLLAMCMLGAAVLSVALFPREHEIALMSFRDAEYGKALRYYESQLAAGDTSIAVVMPLIQTYKEIGQSNRAVEVLERYAQRNPSDAEALALLVKLCKDAVLPGKYAHYLAALHAIAPSDQRAAELANIYNFEQRYDRQIAVLEELGGKDNSEGASRLIPLLASLGRKVAAVSAALSDTGGGAALDANAKYIVFRLLVDLRRTHEAIRLAQRWLDEEAATSPRVASFAEWFLYKGYPDHALRLITHQQTELVNAADDVRGVYVSALRATKNFDRLRAFWKQRLAAEGLSEEEESSIMYGLLDLGDHEQALSLLRKRALVKRGNWIFAYIETAVKSHREKELLSYLESEFSHADADIADLQHIATVVLQASPATLATFLAVRAEKDPQTWAILYAEALQRSRQRGVLLAYMGRIVAGGKLDRTVRDQWLHRLIDEGGMARALPHVRRVANQDGGDWRSLYVSALRQLSRSQELRAYLVAAAGDATLTGEARRWLAEEMLREGMKKEALRLFMKLAEGSSPNSTKVRELMFLWGPRLDAAALAWVDRQLANASVDEREGWLRLLLETGATGRVVAWFETPRQAVDGVSRSLYIQALAATGQPQKLTSELARAIGTERDAALLRRYAYLAADAGDMQLAERTWAALQAVAPKDETALRGRGLILFSQRSYAEAESNLSAYLRAHPSDYESNYAYAEVLTNLKRPDEARERYQYTLDLIAALRDKPYGARLAETICLQRLGRKEQAISSFQKLLETYPTQRGLRADFASVLLENNATEMAKSVLGMR